MRGGARRRAARRANAARDAPDRQDRRDAVQSLDRRNRQVPPRLRDRRPRRRNGPQRRLRRAPVPRSQHTTRPRRPRQSRPVRQIRLLRPDAGCPGADARPDGPRGRGSRAPPPRRPRRRHRAGAVRRSVRPARHPHGRDVPPRHDPHRAREDARRGQRPAAFQPARRPASRNDVPRGTSQDRHPATARPGVRRLRALHETGRREGSRAVLFVDGRARPRPAVPNCGCVPRRGQWTRLGHAWVRRHGRRTEGRRRSVPRGTNGGGRSRFPARGAAVLRHAHDGGDVPDRARSSPRFRALRRGHRRDGTALLPVVRGQGGEVRGPHRAPRVP